MADDLSFQPTESVATACGDWAATKAAYNFWKSPKIKPDAIRAAHQYSTVERVKQHDLVLAIQDTTELNFTAHTSKKARLTAEVATQSAIPPEIRAVTVADREADIYELFALRRPQGWHLLIRATHNRRVNHSAKYLDDAISQTPGCGQLTVEVPRAFSRPPRQATLTIRHTT
jgi:50S ribosomal subunit-associated GTPase HflX